MVTAAIIQEPRLPPLSNSSLRKLENKVKSFCSQKVSFSNNYPQMQLSMHVYVHVVGSLKSCAYTNRYNFGFLSW